MNKAKRNIPNILTSIRVLLIPVFLYYVVQPDTTSRVWALVVFIIASITDFFDGYLARKLNQESKFGRIVDPLADKALVVSTIVTFLFLDKEIPIWMVLTIIGRDFLISFMRFLGSRKNIEIRTSRLAKVKTAFQMLSIVLILSIFIARSYHFEIKATYVEGKKLGKWHSGIALEQIKLALSNDPKIKNKSKLYAASIPYFLMLLTTIITIISGIRYIFTNIRVFKPPYNLIIKK